MTQLLVVSDWSEGAEQKFLFSSFRCLTCYHYESCCNGLLAAATVLSITGPVVLLAVELSLSFIVPMGKDATTFTTPKDKRKAGKTQ